MEDEVTCIYAKIEAYNKESTELEGLGSVINIPKSISEFVHDGETYYFVDFGIAFDAPGFILNDACEEVCQLQSLIENDNLPNCSEFNGSLSGAVKIWPTE
ncbi:MAG: hypothetical protein ACJA01_002447 [Saprospiraceae bacterium]